MVESGDLPELLSSFASSIEKLNADTQTIRNEVAAEVEWNRASAEGFERAFNRLANEYNDALRRLHQIVDIQLQRRELANTERIMAREVEAINYLLGGAASRIQQLSTSIFAHHERLDTLAARVTQQLEESSKLAAAYQPIAREIEYLSQRLRSGGRGVAQYGELRAIKESIQQDRRIFAELKAATRHIEHASGGRGA